MPLTTGCLNGEFEQINEWNVTHVIADKKLPIQSEFESHNKSRIQSRIVNVFVSFINNKHHLLNFSRGVARYSPPFGTIPAKSVTSLFAEKFPRTVQNR